MLNLNEGELLSKMVNSKITKLNFILTKWKYILFAIALIWIAYSFLFFGTLNFEEEIRLSSGDVILVKRKIVTSPYGEIGGSGGWEAKFNSIEIIQPKRGDNPVRWETKKNMLPVLFDRDPHSKEWFVLAVLDSCVDWFDLGRPKTSYIEFRYRDSQWQRVDFSQIHLGHSYNVLSNLRSDDRLGLHTLETKTERMSKPGLDQRYVKIIQQLPNC